jgi:hypothetical protein
MSFSAGVRGACPSVVDEQIGATLIRSTIGVARGRCSECSGYSVSAFLSRFDAGGPEPWLAAALFPSPITTKKSDRIERNHVN